MNTKGQKAEQIASAYLQAQGLTLITSNYRSPFGEIDLITRESETLVFIELRKNNFYGGAEASITPLKQHKIVISA